jgi:hypothetical protein
MASCRTGNYLRKVSCRGDTQWHHAGQETVCEKFPVGVIHHSFMQDGKLFAKGFLWRRCTIVSSRTENYLRKVSCRGDTQWHHAGQETVCEKFPVGVIHHSFMQDGKLFAKGFLWRRYTIVSCRTGNYLRKVSCRGDIQWCPVSAGHGVLSVPAISQIRAVKNASP